MSIMVVGPRFGGRSSSYHLAPDVNSPSNCGRPAPRKGWREIDDAEANASGGIHEACASNFMGKGFVSSASRNRASGY